LRSTRFLNRATLGRNANGKLFAGGKDSPLGASYAGEWITRGSTFPRRGTDFISTIRFIQRLFSRKVRMTSTTENIVAADAALGPASPRIPHLERWQLLRRVGAGTMAEVYLAAPRGNAAGTAACYAVKVLKPRWENEPTAVSLFAREAQVGSAVSHPHLVPVLDWNLRRPPYHLVMPHLPGATLARRLAAEPKPALPVALWFARQAAQALEALHAAGWTHADIKPSNIFVSPEGHVTLIDLGYARRADETVAAADRPVTGTLGYMAPELLASPPSADIRSDLYALGAVLYEMLAGRPLHEGREELRAAAPRLPQGVVALARRLLAEEPLGRPQTPAELVAQLARLEINTFAERIPA
jgi:serine/threonine protein kinase